MLVKARHENLTLRSNPGITFKTSRRRFLTHLGAGLADAFFIPVGRKASDCTELVTGECGHDRHRGRLALNHHEVKDGVKAVFQAWLGNDEVGL